MHGWALLTSSLLADVYGETHPVLWVLWAMQQHDISAQRWLQRATPALLAGPNRNAQPASQPASLQALW
jgi:hypothetical protein